MAPPPQLPHPPTNPLATPTISLVNMRVDHDWHMTKVDPANPMSMGPVGVPPIYTEAKFAHDMALTKALPIIDKCWEELEEVFARFSELGIELTADFHRNAKTVAVEPPALVVLGEPGQAMRSLDLISSNE